MDPHDQSILHSSVECNWRTPPECYQALDREFDFRIDLAADKESCLQEDGIYFGPDHPEEYLRNAFIPDWTKYVRTLVTRRRQATAFLNPPFSKTLMNAYRTGKIKVGREWIPHPVSLPMADTFDIAEWARRCWQESQQGLTIVGIFPFAPQTDWYRRYVYGHSTELGEDIWLCHAATQERRLPHRISFLHPEGKDAGNAGVNSVILVWEPATGRVGPWSPHSFYWSYR